VQGGTKTHAPASQPQREWSWDELAVAPRLSSNPPRAPTRHPLGLGPGGLFCRRADAREGLPKRAPAAPPQRGGFGLGRRPAPRFSSNPPRTPTRHPARLGDGHAARCEPGSFAMSVMSTRTGWGSLC
jgi:hypothetical protein